MMSIEYRDGDIFEQSDLDIIVHQANCFNKMGSGIAREIAKRYPEAVEADDRTDFGDREKLGSYTVAISPKGMVIINLYSQYNYGKNGCYTDYEAMKRGFLDILDEYDSPHIKNVIGIPHGIGCGLAGGDWNIVKDIIEEVFEYSKQLHVVICKI